MAADLTSLPQRGRHTTERIWHRPLMRPSVGTGVVITAAAFLIGVNTFPAITSAGIVVGIAIQVTPAALFVLIPHLALGLLAFGLCTGSGTIGLHAVRAAQPVRLAIRVGLYLALAGLAALVAAAAIEATASLGLANRHHQAAP